MSELQDALDRHNGDPVAVTLAEPFQSWPIGEAMRLLAMLMRELAKRHAR